MRNITKQADVQGLGQAGQEDLEQINALARRELTADEVYLFAVRLCDNEVDRDGERFAAATLEELAELFVGRSGVFDHQWSARGQTARIYRTEVVREERMTPGRDEPYCYLKGYAYLLRTEGNRELIAAIEGGIKKEVSVGCAVERSVCSICGEEFHTCPHEKGAEYGGRRCWAELVGATDAYEWSFVAVPAQRNAGVMKAHAGMEQEAALGRKYLERLRGEVARLACLVQPEADRELMERVARRLDWEELDGLKKLYQAQADRRFVPQSQLWQGEGLPGGPAGRQRLFDLGGRLWRTRYWSWRSACAMDRRMRRCYPPCAGRRAAGSTAG